MYTQRFKLFILREINVLVPQSPIFVCLLVIALLEAKFVHIIYVYLFRVIDYLTRSIVLN